MDLLEKMVEDEPRHPWEVRRGAFFIGLLRSALGSRSVDVLDCGAGDAWFAGRLASELDGIRSVTCWDAHYDDAHLARDRRNTRLSFTRTRPDRRFGLILMLDVIEHVEDDVGFVREIVGSCLDDDGTVLVSVPAWQALFGRHDTFLHHHRRYSPTACDRVLAAAGLRVIGRGGAFHSLVLPRAAAVAAEKLASATGRSFEPLREPPRWSHGRLLTTAVERALEMDNALSHVAARAKLNLPGLSYWAVCKAG